MDFRENWLTRMPNIILNIFPLLRAMFRTTVHLKITRERVKTSAACQMECREESY